MVINERVNFTIKMCQKELENSREAKGRILLKRCWWNSKNCMLCIGCESLRTSHFENIRKNKKKKKRTKNNKEQRTKNKERMRKRDLKNIPTKIILV
jgi:hypothetical protein